MAVNLSPDPAMTRNLKDKKAFLFHPSIFSRIFHHSSSWQLELRDEHFELSGVAHSYSSIKNVSTRTGWLWSTLTISFDDQTHDLFGMRHALARNLEILLSTRHKIIVSMKTLQKHLDIENDAYFSESDRLVLIKALPSKDEVLKLLQLPNNWLERLPTLKNQTDVLLALVNDDRAVIIDRNKTYAEKEIKNFNRYFESVEKQPLTSEQMRSAVIMEDRNLLVACAGSGKTSTIIGKVGYALQKGICSPSQILILSFNKEVVEELKSRVASRIGSIAEGVSVKTFHKLGLDILSDATQAVRVAPWIAGNGNDPTVAHICGIINELCERDNQFASSFAIFCALNGFSAVDEMEQLVYDLGAADIKSLVNQQADNLRLRGIINSYKCFAGSTVRSLQELRIANWLTLNGVSFEYEKPFKPLPEKFAWPNGYRPDFFYPDIGCWHEHFGINKLGKPPQFFLKDKGTTYQEQMRAKRDLLAAAGADWFETTSAEFYNDDWDQILRTELEKRGVKLKFVGWEKCQEYMADSSEGAIRDKDFATLIATTIKHYKSNRITPAELEAKCDLHPEAARAKAFVRLFNKIYDRYEHNLRRNGYLDFEDMIIKSIEKLDGGWGDLDYKMILVDEFQDISECRAGLIKSLLNRCPGAKLFAFGDDWQSIYRFAGSDINTMTHFSDRFGYSAITYLTQTFRSNEPIAKAAADFVMKNNKQMRKEIIARQGKSAESIEIINHGPKDLWQCICAKLSQISDGIVSGEERSVLFLGRYRHLIPQSDRLDDLKKFFPRLNLDAMTVHKAKGLEADIVIVVGMGSQRNWDFPSKKQNDRLISLFMPEPDPMPYAEERRLFYVALTRARHKVILMAPTGHESPFVKEIQIIAGIKRT